MYIYIYISVYIYPFYIHIYIYNDWFQQFPQTLSVPSAAMFEDIGNFKHQLDVRRQRERKKKAQCSRIWTLKCRYFPRVARNPLREVSYWPRNSIKRSNIESPSRPLRRELHRNHNGRLLSWSIVISKTYFRKFASSRRTNHVSAEFPLREQRKIVRETSFFFLYCTIVTRIS